MDKKFSPLNIGDDRFDDAADLIMAASLNEQDEEQADEAVYEPELPLPDEDGEELPEVSVTKRKKGFIRPVLFMVIVCFCIIAAADIVSQQNEIEQLEQETVMMNNKIEETKQLNDEYTALLDADEADFMERVAVEQLGYSYPNERRYYIVSRSE